MICRVTFLDRPRDRRETWRYVLQSNAAISRLASIYMGRFRSQDHDNTEIRKTSFRGSNLDGYLST